MKVMLIDSRMDGHHITYMRSILEMLDEVNTESLVCAPDQVDCAEKNRTVVCSSQNYFRWMHRLEAVVKKEKPDVVHFLYGDDLYRYFGAGLSWIGKHAQLFITFHQVRRSYLHDLSLKMISASAKKVVVHTESLEKDFHKLGIHNVQQIEYPRFNMIQSIDQKKAKKMLGIPDGEAPVLLALGATRYDKGIDILLDALDQVSSRFHLVVAGKEDTISESVIREKIRKYQKQVTLILRFLSDEEFACCLSASDIVVLPYRKSFDGASGPLGEGVALGKMIVGANHGSLGKLIKGHHLGLTFETENAGDLTKKLEEALSGNWEPDDKYYEYQKALSPARFQAEYEKLYKE